MKTIRSILVLGMASFAFLAMAPMGRSCPPDPDPKPDPTPAPPEPTPSPANKDPVFIISPYVFTGVGGPMGAKSPAPATTASAGDSMEAQRLAKSLEGVKDPVKAREVACEAWKSEVSVDLQRHALALARSLAKNTADIQLYDFLLSALDDPSAQQEKCLQLGRGNGLEKKQAADRLAWLLQNPALRERLK